MSAPSSFGSFRLLPLPAGLDVERAVGASAGPLRPDRQLYAAAAPLAALTVPEQIATFSYDEQHRRRHDDSSIRYFADPPEGANLELGYERWVEKEEDNGRLDSLLEAYARAVESGRSIAKPHVMTWRGMMTKIVTALCEDREGWEMNAMLLDDTLYLEDNKAYAESAGGAEGSQKRSSKDVPEHQRKMMYAGYAFESYCTVERPGQRAPVGHEPEVNTNMQWCSIIQTSLGPTNVVLGGEVDCVRGEYSGKTGNYVELKTSGAIKNERDERNFERKTLKYWAQSYLLGIPEVIVGFRSARSPYYLESTQSFDTYYLPRIGVKAGWSASACLNWANVALQYIRQRIANETRGAEDEARMFRVAFRPGDGLQVWPLSPEEAFGVQTADSVKRTGFLPEDYVMWMNGRRRAVASQHGPP